MKKYDIIFYILVAIFLMDIIYLLFVESISNNILYCPSNGFIDCNAVINSQYSKIFGIPLPILSLIYIIVLIISYFIKPKYALYIWIIGVIFSIYLFMIEIFIIHHICIYCTTAYIDNGLIFISLYYKIKE